ncbi:hypothetical protein DFH07DRAFT_813397 [Mycena maculata]|uniref:RRM domain-containing protein n=1 Tax=Mycena maculata TaxID=230809 RepID=A0AAD7NJ24_9AGAR|nr:hypothetical protein DFH07DRAFT_813397 [Mycena maculata]
MNTFFAFRIAARNLLRVHPHGTSPCFGKRPPIHVRFKSERATLVNPLRNKRIYFDQNNRQKEKTDKPREPREPWIRREYDTRASDSSWEQTPLAGPWRTISIHNTPTEAPIKEVLDLVTFGPIFLVEDSVIDGSRVVSLTFFDSDTALAFYREATNNRFIFHGRPLKFSWGQGPDPPRLNWKASRALLLIPGINRLTTGLTSYMTRFGPVDRIQVVKEDGRADRVYVNFLDVASCRRAVEHLQTQGFDVKTVADRCRAAGMARTTALEKRSRTVVLSDIPRSASVADVCDQIRGGALHEINYIPRSEVAFVYFLKHSSAASFLHHTIYRGIMVNNKRISAQFVPESPELPPFLLEHVRLGASRCLGIQGVVDPNMLREDCKQYGVERVFTSELTTTVAFTHLDEAIKASRLLPYKERYIGLKMVFLPDPCAGPFHEEVEEATALQAEIASLLIPPEVHQSPTDAAGATR